MKVGLYGGSFNPPHLGHTLAVNYALSRYDLDEVWVVPCYQHAFGKELLSFEHRLQMVKIAMRHLRRVQILTVEKDLGGVSSTIDTVRHLYNQHKDLELFLLIGDDLLSQVWGWKEADELLRLSPMKLLNRGEILPAVSSTAIRNSWNKKGCHFSEMLDARVISYLEESEISWPY